MRPARLVALLCLGAPLCLDACHSSPTVRPMAVPTLNSRSNPENVPGYVSPCAGGQPRMQYNCSQLQN